MPNVTIYTTKFCPYCVRAKMLLDKKDVEYNEVRVDKEPDQRKTMEERSGRTSVPQIFIDDFHVGGCDDLFALEASGDLNPKLALAGETA